MTSRSSTIVLTGAGGLLGRQHVKALLCDDHTLIATDIKPESLDFYRTSYPERIANGQIILRPLDVTNPDSFIDLLDYFNEHKIVPNALINNAALNPAVSGYGIRSGQRIEDYDMSMWCKELSVGLTGAFLAVKYLLPLMIKSSLQINVVNISSDLSVISPNQSLYAPPNSCSNEYVKPFSYSVIKAGLHGLTLYLATYLPDGRLRANTLSPGGIFVDQPDWFVERVSRLIPAGRMAREDEYHSAIRFLLSPDSEYFNGQNLIVDGGRSSW